MSGYITNHKNIEHPLEEVFDIEPNTTVVEYKEVVPDEAVPMHNYDQKDDEIEGKIEEVYAIAITQVGIINDEMERVEGKYKARMSEVAATMLNVALGAIREKSSLKMHKDKIAPISGQGPHTVNNTMNIVADRNELLRMFAEKNKPKTQPE